VFKLCLQRSYKTYHCCSLYFGTYLLVWNLLSQWNFMGMLWSDYEYGVLTIIAFAKENITCDWTNRLFSKSGDLRGLLNVVSYSVHYCVSDLTCGSFPGPGISDHPANVNPMREFVHGDDSHVENMFEQFKNTFNKKYHDKHDHEQRKHYFRNNLRSLDSRLL